MTHWGWYWRVKRQHVSKAICDYKTSIDSFAMFKEGGYRAFNLAKEGKPILTGEVKEDVLSIISPKLSYNIPIEKQPCHFGGYRYYFRCPISHCNKRMRKLYHHDCVFACRRCFKLGYWSQTLTPSIRFGQMERKVEKKLESLGGSRYTKPKHMRWKSFKALQSKAESYYWKSEEAMAVELFERYGMYP